MRTSSRMGQNNISGSGLKTGRSNAAELSKSTEKRYIVDKSKFVNTRNYVIDFEDVSNEDIVYEPQPVKE